MAAVLTRSVLHYCGGRHAGLYYYQAVVRPVLEYASPCWQASLTKEQTKQLEDVQRRALQIVFGNIPYDEARRTCNILSQAERRHELVVKDFSRESSRTSPRCSTNHSTALC